LLKALNNKRNRIFHICRRKTNFANYINARDKRQHPDPEIIIIIIIITTTTTIRV